MSSDFDACNNEPVKFMDSIQNFGALIVVDGLRRIVQVAVGHGLDLSVSSLLGRSIDEALPSVARSVFPALANKNELSVPLLVKTDGNQWVTCLAHRVAADQLATGSSPDSGVNSGVDLSLDSGYVILELERVISSSGEIPSVKFKTDRTDSIEAYLAYAVENVQSITGFDRVMAYRFAADWHGEVVAEALAPRSKAASFLHHHFPASDIPPPARELFVKNWVRMIADVDSTTEPLHSVPGLVAKIDLSRSALRAASPIHIDYLKSMGVSGTLTMSLICDGKLWGLIACHHYQPKYLAAEHRSVLGLIAKLISSKITALNNLIVEKSLLQTSSFIQSFLENIRGKASALTASVRDHKIALKDIVNCDGFSYINGDDIVTAGVTPDREQLFALRSYLRDQKQDYLFTDSINRMAPEMVALESVSPGLIAMHINEQWFIWHRHEQIRSILWAGDPDSKQIYREGGNLRVSPRQSFNSWREQVKGQAVGWRQHEIDAVKRLQEFLTGLFVQHHELAARPAGSFAEGLLKSADQQSANLREQFGRTRVEGLNFGECDDKRA